MPKDCSGKKIVLVRVSFEAIEKETYDKLMEKTIKTGNTETEIDELPGVSSSSMNIFQFNSEGQGRLTAWLGKQLCISAMELPGAVIMVKVE